MSLFAPRIHLGRPCLARPAVNLCLVSALSTTVSIFSKLAIAIAVLSVLSLIATLVLYFQEIEIPPLLMACGLWGLPLACLFAVGVVIGSIIRRRNN